MALVSTAQLPLTAGTPPSRPEPNPKFDPHNLPGMGRRGLMPRVKFGSKDAWVAKYKDQPATGEKRLVWKKQLGTSSSDSSGGVATDSTGNIFISGATYGNLGGSNQGSYDAWVAKYSPDGTLLWKKQLGTSSGDSSGDVATDSTGNIFISGFTDGDLGGSNQGRCNAWVAKYSPKGTLLWTKQLGTSGYDVSQGVATDSKGKVFISGATTGKLGVINKGEEDAWVAQYTPNGLRGWVRQEGTIRYDTSSDVATDGSGNVVMIGDAFGNFSKD